MNRFSQVDLARPVDALRATYQYNETCQGTVPEAIYCFMEAEDLKDVIRNGTSIGGDFDTLAAITGSIAEAKCGVPEEIGRKVEERMDVELSVAYQRFVIQ